MTNAGAKLAVGWDVSELECRRFWWTGCLSGATGGKTEQTEFPKLPKKLSEEIGSADSLISFKATFSESLVWTFLDCFLAWFHLFENFENFPPLSIGAYEQKKSDAAILAITTVTFCKTHYQSLITEILTPHAIEVFLSPTASNTSTLLFYLHAQAPSLHVLHC